MRTPRVGEVICMAPQMFGPFHIGVALGGGAAAVILAKIVSRGADRSEGCSSQNGSANIGLYRLLFVCGLVMAASEVWKQLFYYRVVYHAFNWWYFPFQLCSVPMYLCLALPALKERGRTVVCTFLWSFTFLGTAAALIYPQDMLRPYTALTAHAFGWHLLLVFISFVCFFGRLAGDRARDFGGAVLLFLGLAGVATAVNVIGEHAGTILGTYPNMFYISPYHLSDQPGFHGASQVIGIWPAIAVYLAGIVGIAAVLHGIYAKTWRFRVK